MMKKIVWEKKRAWRERFSIKSLFSKERERRIDEDKESDKQSILDSR